MYSLHFKTKSFYFQYTCIWWKSSLPSCSWKLHAVIKKITRAAWRKAASNGICWIQGQQTYRLISNALPREGKTFKPVRHYHTQERKETSLNPAVNECPTTSLGKCSVTRIRFFIPQWHNYTKPPQRSQTPSHAPCLVSYRTPCKRGCSNKLCSDGWEGEPCTLRTLTVYKDGHHERSPTVKLKHLDHPMVTGSSSGYKCSPSMLLHRTN